MDAFLHVCVFPLHQITKKSTHLLESVVKLPLIFGKTEHIYPIKNSNASKISKPRSVFSIKQK